MCRILSNNFTFHVVELRCQLEFFDQASNDHACCAPADTSLSFKKSKVIYVQFISLKFIYSEKATKFCEISTLLLTGTT